MNETLTISLMVLVLLAVIAIPSYFLFKWALKKGGKKDELHKLLADELGLRHTVTKSGLVKLNTSQGLINGREVKIREEMIRVGRGSATLVTYLTISPNPFDFDFTISKKNILNEIGKKTGLIKEVKVGVESFDKVFLQQTSDISKYTELMTSNNQEALLSIQTSLKAGIKSTPKSLNYEMGGSFNTEAAKEHFKAVLNYLELLAKP